MEFQWKTGAPAPKISAQVFGETVAKIAENGYVQIASPKDIVNEARRRGSPIRDAFEWDEAKAAEAHRIDQARKLVGALHIVRVHIRDAPSFSTRAFHSVKVDGKRGYIGQNRVFSDRDLKIQVIGNAKRDLESFLSKYAGLVASMGTFVPRLHDVISDMQDEIDRLATDATARRAPPKAGAPSAVDGVVAVP